MEVKGGRRGWYALKRLQLIHAGVLEGKLLLRGGGVDGGSG